jgi:hypothetical protein
MLLPALSKVAAMVPPPIAALSTVPAWVALCGNMAPVVSMAVFFAVGLRSRKIHSVIILTSFVCTDDPLLLSQPYPTIQQVSKEKTVGSLPILPYSSMIMSCLLWGVSTG